MQLSKLVRGVLLGLPIIAVSACSSTNMGTDGSNTRDSNLSASTVTRGQLNSLQELKQHRNSTVYFDFDKYAISADFTNLLDQHGAFLRANPTMKVVIAGHADERGTPEYNIALGERRANAVKSYLQGLGVTASQIAIVSYGKEKPAVEGHSPEVYAKNRRAVITY